LVRQNIRLWFGPGLAPGKVLFPRSSSDFSWREAMQKPERNRRAHRRQSAPRFDVTASRLDALKPGQPARFAFDRQGYGSYRGLTGILPRIHQAGPAYRAEASGIGMRERAAVSGLS